MHFVVVTNLFSIFTVHGKNDNSMATVKKQSKSMKFQNEKSNDIEKAKKALSDGAIFLVDTKGGYAIEYPTGGYFKVTKSVFNALNNKNHINHNQ